VLLGFLAHEDKPMSRFTVICSRCGYRAFVSSWAETSDWLTDPDDASQRMLCPTCVEKDRERPRRARPTPSPVASREPGRYLNVIWRSNN